MLYWLRRVTVDTSFLHVDHDPHTEPRRLHPLFAMRLRPTSSLVVATVLFATSNIPEVVGQISLAVCDAGWTWVSCSHVSFDSLRSESILRRCSTRRLKHRVTLQRIL